MSNPVYHSYHASNECSNKDTEEFEVQCFNQTIQKLREKIYYKRHDLLMCFTQMDVERRGIMVAMVTNNQFHFFLIFLFDLMVIHCFCLFSCCHGYR